MCDDDIHVGLIYDPTVSRRTFGLAAVAVAGLGSAAHAQTGVTEKDVEVKTADGTADAVLYHPAGTGSWPAVLIWPDVVSLRPAFREMGRRLAAEGYVVLVPNLYYRVKRAPVGAGAFDYNTPDDRAKLFACRGAMSDAGVDNDSKAYIAFLDAQPQTNRKKKVGVQGYCMGGPLSFRTAAAVPTRIAAVGSFHGGGLTTKNPDSPHLLVAKTKASYLICVAKNDDARAPNDKETLKTTFAETKRPATVEVYGGDHGWTVKGSQVYNEAEAERAWSALSALYKKSLA